CSGRIRPATLSPCPDSDRRYGAQDDLPAPGTQRQVDEINKKRRRNPDGFGIRQRRPHRAQRHTREGETQENQCASEPRQHVKISQPHATASAERRGPGLNGSSKFRIPRQTTARPRAKRISSSRGLNLPGRCLSQKNSCPLRAERSRPPGLL